jgi:hypothetical protein
LRTLKGFPFFQSLRQTQILILEIQNVFLWLKFSSFLTLKKMERFSEPSVGGPITYRIYFFPIEKQREKIISINSGHIRLSLWVSSAIKTKRAGKKTRPGFF